MTNKEAIVWLKECKEHYGEYHEMCDEALDIAIKALEERPQGEWIPTSDRLPECMDNVLVTIQVGNRNPVVRSGYYAYGLFNIDNGDVWNWNDTEVKAWMPQPMPYEEVENES